MSIVGLSWSFPRHCNKNARDHTGIASRQLIVFRQKFRLAIVDIRWSALHFMVIGYSDAISRPGDRRMRL